MVVVIFVFSRLSISIVWRVFPRLLYTTDILIYLSFTFIWTVGFSIEVVRIVINWCMILFWISIAVPSNVRLPNTVVLSF